MSGSKGAESADGVPFGRLDQKWAPLPLAPPPKFYSFALRSTFFVLNTQVPPNFDFVLKLESDHENFKFAVKKFDQMSKKTADFAHACAIND